ncbi:uncharacterized protein V1513DRAFT_452045 [Lipomyces chichibuensis]|uniref:uncharacterized protein n=1 Tax=Lipomyces chichibuensis TaxID=1546026 RepID=UPI003343472B
MESGVRICGPTAALHGVLLVDVIYIKGLMGRESLSVKCKIAAIFPLCAILFSMLDIGPKYTFL